GLLGGALKRSRAVPAWAGIAVLLGGATHPFIPTSLGQGIGLLVAAAGFVGVSVALLRMSNDDFDLPPVRVASRPVPREAPRRGPGGRGGSLCAPAPRRGALEWPGFGTAVASSPDPLLNEETVSADEVYPPGPPGTAPSASDRYFVG